jgi:hypothetical protein
MNPIDSISVPVEFTVSITPRAMSLKVANTIEDCEIYVFLKSTVLWNVMPWIWSKFSNVSKGRNVCIFEVEE